MIDPELLQRALVSRIEALEAEAETFDDGLAEISVLMFGSYTQDQTARKPFQVAAQFQHIKDELQRLGVGQLRANGDPNA